MNKSIWMLGALAAAVGGAAQAHPMAYGPSYGPGYLPPAPYAAAGYGYEVTCKQRSLRLLGARLGVTVLGVDADADANLRIGAGRRCHRTVVTVPVAQPSVMAPVAPPMAYDSYGRQGGEPPHYRW